MKSSMPDGYTTLYNAITDSCEMIQQAVLLTDDPQELKDLVFKAVFHLMTAQAEAENMYINAK